MNTHFFKRTRYLKLNLLRDEISVENFSTRNHESYTSANLRNQYSKDIVQPILAFVGRVSRTRQRLGSLKQPVSTMLTKPAPFIIHADLQFLLENVVPEEQGRGMVYQHHQMFIALITARREI
jgi:hypothetical protein